MFETLMKKASKTTLPLFKGDSGLPQQSSWKRNLKRGLGFSEEHYLQKRTELPLLLARLPCIMRKESKMDVFAKWLFTEKGNYSYSTFPPHSKEHSRVRDLLVLPAAGSVFSPSAQSA